MKQYFHHDDRDQLDSTLVEVPVGLRVGTDREIDEAAQARIRQGGGLVWLTRSRARRRKKAAVRARPVHHSSSLRPGDTIPPSAPVHVTENAPNKGEGHNYPHISDHPRLERHGVTRALRRELGLRRGACPAPLGGTGRLHRDLAHGQRERKTRKQYPHVHIYAPCSVALHANECLACWHADMDS